MRCVQAQFLKAVLPLLLVVDHHSQSELVLIQRVAPDNTQPVQRQTAKLVEGKQDVACHLPDRLWYQKTCEKENLIELFY